MKKIVILGSGESGTGAAILAKRVGYDVFVSDKSPIKQQYKDVLEQQGIAYEEGTHSMAQILEADEVIKSPGIPEKTEVMKAIRAKGIPVIGEIEFGYRYAGDAKIIAITGSNGKTTTTTLTYHLLKTAGLNVFMGGNVGDSFAGLVLEALENPTTEPRIYVLELSSFQLDDIDTFRPNIAMLLNITPDHLDRYEYRMENYVQSKFRIVRNQQLSDLFITNADDESIQHFMENNPGIIHPVMQQVSSDHLQNGYVMVDEYAFDLSSTRLKGPHNAFNASCAIRAALEVGVSAEDIIEGLLSFSPPPHRLEQIGQINGVNWINDSKATNVDSVFFALQAVNTPIVWIVGGTDKGNDYTPLLHLVRERVKAIVCLGVDNEKLKTVFGSFGMPMAEAKSAVEAVKLANELALPGDTVLLSPACASFDLFKNYEDRGDQFRAAVLELSNDQ